MNDKINDLVTYSKNKRIKGLHESINKFNTLQTGRQLIDFWLLNVADRESIDFWGMHSFKALYIALSALILLTIGSKCYV
jgi:hypothetical protein